MTQISWCTDPFCNTV